MEQGQTQETGASAAPSASRAVRLLSTAGIARATAKKDAAARTMAVKRISFGIASIEGSCSVGTCAELRSTGKDDVAFISQANKIKSLFSTIKKNVSQV